MYEIRTVDTGDEDIAETLTDLHRLTFFDGAAMPRFDLGAWWFACRGDEAVAFAGVAPSTHVRNSGYFCRVGVLRSHWGHGSSSG
ncbi:GNAT family N-acetyltransferase [Bradyrhizobium centrolobii]|uniref:GNAT family N-acetyltransferase n=1 Tax=Bradyrhizobium centrolobii TaxID=1505087 RepID=UPI000B204E22